MRTIERLWNGFPRIVEDKIEAGCMIENTLACIGTIIVDEEFINEMYLIADEVKDDKSLVSLMSKIYNKIVDYFSSSIKNDKSRQQTYINNVVVDEDGLILGTKLSSLKGKNISQCSEKSIAAYIILEKLYSMGNITRKPSFVLSNMKTELSNPGPHAFVMLNKECDNPTKHLLFDVENPTILEDTNKEKHCFVGLYSLTDEQNDNFINGQECSPISLYEYMDDYKEISEKRVYGNIKREKSL